MLRQKHDYADRNDFSQLHSMKSHRVQASHSTEIKGKVANDQKMNSDVEVGNHHEIRSSYKSKPKEMYPKSFAKLPNSKDFGYATDDTYDLEFLEELDEKKELFNEEIKRAERRIRDVVGIQIAPIRSVEHNYSGMKINHGAPKSTKKVIRTLLLPTEAVKLHPVEERYHRDMAIMKLFTNQPYHRSRTDKAESTSVDQHRWKERMSSQGKHRHINRSRDLTTEQTEDGLELSRVGRLPVLPTSEKKRLEIMTTDDDLDASNLGKKAIDRSFDYWKEDRNYRLVSAKKRAANLQGLPADGYRLQRVDLAPISPVSRNVLRKDSSQRSRIGAKVQKPKTNSQDLVDWAEVEGGPTSAKVEASFRSRKGRLGLFMKELALLSRNIEDLVVREHQVGMILHHEKTAHYLSTQYRLGDGPTAESEDTDPRIASVQAAMLRRSLAAASRVDSFYPATQTPFDRTLGK